MRWWGGGEGQQATIRAVSSVVRCREHEGRRGARARRRRHGASLGPFTGGVEAG